MFLYTATYFVMQTVLNRSKLCFSRFRKPQGRHISTNGFSQRQEAVQKLIFYGIVGGNVAVFACWQLAGEDRFRLREMTKHFTVSEYGVRYKHLYHTIVTSFFSHKTFMHLALNMFGFITFGYGVLKELGSGRFLVLYYGGGIISSLCHVYAPSLVPRYWPSQRKLENSFGLGASGAISSLIVWNTCRFPSSMVYLFGFVPIPAVVALLGFGAFDCYNLYSGDVAISSASHLGGAAFGAAFFLLMRRPLRR